MKTRANNASVEDFMKPGAREGDGFHRPSSAETDPETDPFADALGSR